MSKLLIVRDLGLSDYQDILERLKQFNARRPPSTPDEIWLMESSVPIYAKGLSSPIKNRFDNGSIPIVTMERGGDITFHGPGQLLACFLLDIRNVGIEISKLVSHIEQAIVNVLDVYGIRGHLKAGAPGIYVDNRKIASLGFRSKSGLTSFGAALNVNMDLAPFSKIRPCGYEGLEMTQICELNDEVTVANVREPFITKVVDELGRLGLTYAKVEWRNGFDAEHTRENSI